MSKPAEKPLLLYAMRRVVQPNMGGSFCVLNLTAEDSHPGGWVYILTKDEYEELQSRLPRRRKVKK